MVRVLEQSGRLPSPAMTAWAARKTAETRKLFENDNTSGAEGVSDSVLWLLGAEALLQLVQVHGVRPGFDWWSSLLQRLADHTPLHLWSPPGNGAADEASLAAEVL
ncbi:hypothetical protein HaLaN_19565 [Haematococcus lacustris]|uniref:Uncharacterized protein n=1 Tax=Haematococcus lacustris TaxID=44745 RepID=A0A699ZHG1_HAELA|nr:hypothetical protein HaLaN_19565 [Haematococcus lacustris]